MKIQIGSTTVTSVYEQDVIGLSNTIPSAAPDALAELAWLDDRFVDATGELLGVVQAFVVEHGGKLVVVDTCVGDNKENVVVPEWAHRRTGFLERFLKAGFNPADVDAVVCTHLHMDHVGWNTFLDGDRWKPTFPNSRYLFARREHDHWRAQSQSSPTDPSDVGGDLEPWAQRVSKTQVAVYQESVQPIVDAGLALLVDMDHVLVPGLRLVPTPGHTPGHVAVEITSGGEKAFLSGDSFHHPCQIAHPEWANAADENPAASTGTRRMVLHELADSETLFIGSHFPEPVAGTIARDADSYRFDTRA
ncbi:MBL fold metallo-hydrolase [Mycobacterium spongiae]|uniref:MBL fold metallo-hydrolase n=1 Tax=Mycobacterium spongiae TaxID=886343 RepID=A0A975PYJ1_9MYCO|nr:MBL fold metallo-hydrolase [Mycobacterium spongiae]QUR69371.1 MBL fold metallo-hydrolase [Mycobacterium spongiae]